ncbi:MAG: hypothetical protein M1831_006345 [Alyxoria varia]|nr:MAG: hypothetical protein M1831_006345 [Alyxoria varia]
MESEAIPDLDNEDCAICSEKQAKRCNKCKSISYCSKECQTADWKSHKLVCNQFACMKERPNPSLKLGIKFLPEEGNPILIWANGDQFPEELFVDSPDYHTTPRQLEIEQNVIRDRELNGSVILRYDDNFACNGSKHNVCLRKACGRALSREWRGPVGIVAFSGFKKYDSTGSGYRDALDYYVAYCR